MDRPSSFRLRLSRRAGAPAALQFMTQPWSATAGVCDLAGEIPQCVQRFRFWSAFAFALTISSSAFADGTATFKVLIDADNATSTGCTIATPMALPGIDLVLTTKGEPALCDA